MSFPAQRQVVRVALTLACLVGCSTGAPAPSENDAAGMNVSAAKAERPAIPAPETRLDREALLIAAFRARSAAGAGTNDTAEQEELDGKRFEFRIRLGCSFADSEPPANLRARVNAERRTVELEAVPDLTVEQPEVEGIAGDGFEAAEGFWIPRFWLLTPSCAGTDSSQPGLREGRTFGLAQFFTQIDARTDRRNGRGYQARQQLEEGQEASPGVWDLVIRGRLRKAGSERVILCRSVAPGAAPSCIISAEFEFVMIEDVRSGAVLARWERG